MLVIADGTAFAEIVPNPASGDIFVGFRASAGEGSSSSYLVKVGTYAEFNAVPGGSSISLGSLGDLGADLTETYGSDWHGRVDLHWGAFGVGSAASAIIYGSRERKPVGSVSVAWPNLTDITRSSTWSQINSVLASIGGYRSRTATANSPVATVQENFAGAASYNHQVSSPGTTDFGSVSQWTGIEGGFGDGTSGTALDLYRITSSGVARLGYFTISPSGVITYTSPAVSLDTDNDGLPDAWETEHFANWPAPGQPDPLRFDGNDDPDGDGRTNAEEWLFGTNPTSGSSSFGLAGFSKSASAVTFSFPAIPSRTYHIYHSTSLSAESWQLVETLGDVPSPETLHFQDTDPARIASPKGFYRVAVTAP